MLDAMRRGAKTWVAKLLMIVLVASFAVWGISGSVNIYGSSSVASVGGTDIGVTEFQRNYNTQLQNLSRQMGQPVNRDFAQALGLPKQVLSQMMSEATLTESARNMGMGISNEGLAQEIADDPNLRPPGSSTFDRNYFTRLLQENNISEGAYIADRRLFSMRSQLTNALVGGLTSPAAYVAALDRHRAETRAIKYAVLPAAAAGPAPVPGDSDLDTWYKENAERFRAPEYRSLSILAVDPAAIADPATVDEADARKAYDRDLVAVYTTPEMRRVRQVLFPSREEADAAAVRLGTGATLDVIAKDRGVTPGDLELGLVAAKDIVDPKIAEAAFALEVGKASDPIEARFGFAIVDVTEIAPSAVRPFDAVKDEIRKSIAEKNAEREVSDLHNTIEDKRAEGNTLAEVARSLNLKLITVETDATGLDPAGNVITPIPQSGEVLNAAFQAEEGDETDPVQAGKGLVWYSIDKVTPAADRPLDQVRAEVVTAWTDEKTAEALAKKAEELAESVRKGGDLEALAKAAGGEVKTAADLTRESQPEDLPGDGVNAVFGGPTGHVAVVPGAGGTQVVLQVTDATVPPFFPEAADSAAIAGQLSGQLGNSLLALYVDEAQAELGSSINEQMVQTIVGTSAR